MWLSLQEMNVNCLGNNLKYQQSLFVLIQFPKECVCDKLSHSVKSFSGHFKVINNFFSCGCCIIGLSSLIRQNLSLCELGPK